MLKYIFAPIFILCSLVAFSSPTSNRYPFRDISSPIIPNIKYDKIFILSPHRTGSTLTYMVFQYLFESKLESPLAPNKKIVKVHNAKICKSFTDRIQNSFVAIVIRNPRESFLSYLKAKQDQNKRSLSKHEILNLIYLHYSEHLEIIKFIKTFPKKRFTVFYYEDFANNMDNLLVKIEKSLAVNIPKKEKNTIKLNFSKQKILKRAKKLANFSKDDPILGIHGNHISTKNTKLSEIIPPELLRKFNRKFQTIRRFFKY